MVGRDLTRAQKARIGELLIRAVVNKMSPYPVDLERAALILYDLNRFGYHTADSVMRDILQQPDKRFSDTMIVLLEEMANTISCLVEALDNSSHSSFRVNQAEIDGLAA